MGSKGPSWADQWGDSVDNDDNYMPKKLGGSSSSKGMKMAEVKAAASAGFDKAKTATTLGAQKVKSGTSVGIRWVKNQYNKFSSK